MPLALLLFLVAQPSIPEALRRFEEARAAIRFADVEFEFTDAFDPKFPAHTMRYRGLFADNDVATFPMAPEDGITGWTTNEAGEIVPDTFPPILVLRSDGRKWSRSIDTILSRAWEDASRCPFWCLDVRLLGLSGAPSVMWDNTVAGEVFAKFNPNTQYTEEKRDGLHVVTGMVSGGGGTRYWIDPQKDWNATRVEYIGSDGAIRATTVLEYQRIDDVWFPVHCEYLDADGNSKGSVHVHAAEINTPDLPRRLTPENIGIEDGSPTVDMADGQRQKFYMDGRLIESDDFNEGMTSGRYRRGPIVESFLAHRGKLPPPSVDELKAIRPRRVLDPWERYTLDFIARYRLDERQRREALQHLRRAQGERDERMPRIRRELAELGDDEKSTAKREALLAPIERIFEDRLKPALFRLPTPEQIDESGDPEGIKAHRRTAPRD